MACARCQKNKANALSGFTNAPIIQGTINKDLLSAPVLQAGGWVRTCTMCGTRTIPTQILEDIIPNCSCHKKGA